MEISIVDGVTLGTAMVGAVLGVFNLWKLFERDRIRVKVVPKSYITTFGASGVCIEVINLSYFSVTVSSVGFAVRGGGRWFTHRSLFENLPQRLESRAAFTAYLVAGVEKHEGFALVRSAVVKTACGCRFCGSSASLRSYIKAARAAKKAAAKVVE